MNNIANKLFDAKIEYDYRSLKQFEVDIKNEIKNKKVNDINNYNGVYILYYFKNQKGNSSKFNQYRKRSDINEKSARLRIQYGKMPPKFIEEGIYYIGESHNILRRLKQHFTYKNVYEKVGTAFHENIKKFYTKKRYDEVNNIVMKHLKFKYLLLESGRSELEEYLIHNYKTIYNGEYNKYKCEMNYYIN